MPAEPPYSELCELVRGDISRREAPAGDDESLAEMIEKRRWILSDGGYHLDTTHLSSTVRIAEFWRMKTVFAKHGNSRNTAVGFITSSSIPATNRVLIFTLLTLHFTRYYSVRMSMPASNYSNAKPVLLIPPNMVRPLLRLTLIC